MTAITPMLLRAPQVAEVLSISTTTVYDRVKAGHLPAPIKWHGVSVWRVKDLEAFVDGLQA